MADKTKSVMVGMSGGVDSTVTAHLLQQQGYEVVGVTFQLWSPETNEGVVDPSCNTFDNIRDAKKVCEKLGIPHYIFDYQEKFKQKVVNVFVDEYANGRTPNPCVNCNKEIKFGDFLHRAKGMGFDYIATGHYAKIEKDENSDLYLLKEADSKKKDQSYFLYNLTQEQLPYILLPLASYDKAEIRKIAEEVGFEASNKPDSQDICFIPDGDYIGFLNEYTNEAPVAGDFVDDTGKVLGQHTGIRNYTIGQRKGLGIAFGKPMFVKHIDAEKNQVVLGEQEELFSNVLYAKDPNWLIPETLEKPLQTTAKIRYAAQPAKAMVERVDGEPNQIKVTFDEPQRAITAGQSVVFYDNDVVVGGAVII